ncbi:MAG: M3 family oligoendopeptidase [Candidatus Omnitrophica bacterium]|nr:M3 family oligoendopeptidase [Candidatus Omnitrophota bacterium]
MSMSFRSLPVFEKRRFVPEGAVLTKKDEVAALLKILLDREMGSLGDLERLILDRSEFDAALGQAGSILYIEMTCDTADSAKAKAYQDFVENVEPVVKSLEHALNEKILKAQEVFSLPAGRYEIYLRSARAEVELFVDKNIPLQTEVALLSQEYQTVCGAMMVDFEGQERTLPEMSKFLLESDRDLRERAWRATSERRMKDKDRVEEIFDKMRNLRHQIACNAGHENFRDYQFKAYLRYDYTPSDCKAYHKSIREVVVPLRREIDDHRRRMMKVSSLRPWDVAVDVLNRAVLKPFDDVAQLKAGVKNIFHRLDRDLGNLYQDMDSLGLLDLASRKGKAPGGYQNTLAEARKPFIFMNAVGVDDDIRTLLHESGHAFHSYLSAHDPIVDYRHAPMEFCEVASMSMELMANDLITEFYSPQDARRSAVEHLEGMISVLAWVATVDAFQHWMYEHPAHSSGERQMAWVGFHQEFGGGVIDWSGLEEARAYLWHRQLHIFEVPFYYIEYGIAQLGALQLWQQSKKDPCAAIQNYKRGLSLGGSRPLPELFSESGIRFDFSKNMIAPLMDEVYKEWKKLSGL